MAKNKQKDRSNSKLPEPGRTLQGCEGSYRTFNLVKTNKPNETIEKLRVDMEHWMKNEVFEEFRDEDIDLAIVFEPIDENNAVDVDNFLKPVISSLQKHSSDEKNRYLIKDDSQIRRLLIHKREKTSNKKPRLTISFRKHEPTKQMIMRNLEVI